MFDEIPTLASGTAEFAADSEEATAQKSYDFTDGLFVFQDAVNLKSIF